MPLVAIVVIVVVGVLVLASAGLVTVRRRSDTGRRPAAPEPEAVAAPEPEGAAGPEPGAVAAPEPRAVAAPEPRAVAVAEPTSPRLRDRLGRARSLLGGQLEALRSRPVDDRALDQLEEALILADVGLPATMRVLDDLRARLKKSEVVPTPEALLSALRTDLEAIFEGDSPELALAGSSASPVRAGDAAPDPAAPSANGTAGPAVWLVVGVNGVGKTTTIGKLAARETAQGRSVVLAAGDTFRAAAGEQLENWAERSGAHLIRGSEGADPSSVIFDAVQHAAARGADLVIADTAGRLHTKTNLMDELRKVRRVAERLPGHLTEVLLVLDATVGQNGLVQARQFTDAVGVTGVVLTKLDGTAKGGIVLAVRHELDLPVKLVGVGEGAGDLIDFDPKEFVAALFE